MNFSKFVEDIFKYIWSYWIIHIYQRQISVIQFVLWSSIFWLWIGEDPLLSNHSKISYTWVRYKIERVSSYKGALYFSIKKKFVTPILYSEFLVFAHVKYVFYSLTSFSSLLLFSIYFSCTYSIWSQYVFRTSLRLRSSTELISRWGSWRWRLSLREDSWLEAINKRPTEITNDNKWNEMDEKVMTNILALADNVLLNEFFIQ